MKIFDLTHGRAGKDILQGVFSASSLQFEDFKNCFRSKYLGGRFFLPQIWKDEQAKAIFDNVPVFLVETTMANEFITVPECDCMIRIPEDRYETSIHDDRFDIDGWYEAYNDQGRRIIERAWNYSINDLLGVYVSRYDRQVMSRRIFIWVDKIAAYVNEKTLKTQYFSHVGDCTRILFDMVLFHEMAHALMDVSNYGLQPHPEFAYGDPLYIYIEEAMANYIALKALDNREGDSVFEYSPHQLNFIREFVRSQPAGYNDGWNLHEHSYRYYCAWMAIKVLFNSELALILRDLWKNSEDFFVEMCEIVSSVHHEDLLAVKNHEGKFGIANFREKKMIVDYSYDYISLFDEGLCKVFKGGKWGAIDMDGKEVFPCKYDDSGDIPRKQM